MEIYVIALCDDLSRTIVSDTYKKLESKNIKFKKINAINGYDIKNKNILDKYSHKIKKKKLNRNDGLNGHRGCLASHLELITRCSKDNKNYLILEQDACLIDNLDINILNKCSKECKDIVLLDPYNPYINTYNELVKKDVTTDKLTIINDIKKKIKLSKEELKQKNLEKNIRKETKEQFRKLKDKLKYEEDNILFYNYHYKDRHCHSKGAYCYIISPNGAKKILKNIKTGLVPADYLFTSYKDLEVKTTSRTIFRINSKYRAGKYSSTSKNYEETKLLPN